jgi:uncharacterized protein (TIGR03435 family)
MPVRTLAQVSLAMAMAVTMSAQIISSLKAGDPAPKLTYTRIVAFPGDSAGPENFAGRTTVLLFLGPVIANKQTVARWNGLVERFAEKGVNFVWIAKEKEDSLVPFLATHPVRGWMVLDPAEESYKTYGVEGGSGVLIDSHGVIAGFTSGAPQEDQIRAVLDGSAVVIDGQATEDQLDAIFEGKAVRLEARPRRMPPFEPPRKPDVAPLEEPYISVSRTEGTISSTAPDHWVRRGFELKAILSEILGTSPARVELPAALDKGTRYDFVLVPPVEEDDAVMKRQARAGIEKFFQVTITAETRLMDVYVMTRAEGKTPPPESDESLATGSFAVTQTFEVPEELRIPEGTPRTRKAEEEAARRFLESPEMRQRMPLAQLTGLAATGGSMDELRHALEEGLHRPVVDETALAGRYNFHVRGKARTTEQFLEMLRDQAGVSVAPGSRSLEIIVLRPRE